MSAPVDLSLSELRAVVTKAARGAGLAWGLAEEAGWAAEWLARRGMPAADWATEWLAARLDGGVSPVEVGAALSDSHADGTPFQGIALPDGLVAPGYLLPFLHRLARPERSVLVIAEAAWVLRVSAKGGVAFGPGWQGLTQGWRLSDTDEARPPQIAAPRLAVSASVLECLDGLALHTTVPESESSRRDAGATGGDND